jgi:hypothetical protein
MPQKRLWRRAQEDITAMKKEENVYGGLHDTHSVTWNFSQRGEWYFGESNQ